MLSNDIAKRIREAVGLAGKLLENRLPTTEHRPVRNSYAHIWHVIKKKMGKSYKECFDEDEEKIMEIIRHLVDNPY